MRTLGLVCKFVVAPLWHVLERKGEQHVSVVEMSRVYSELHGQMKNWAEDATPLLDGDARPFTGAKINFQSDVLSKLLEKSDDYDALTLELLQALFSVLAVYTAKLLADHLPGGEFHSPSASLQEQSRTVSNTNAVSERDFAQQDRMMRKKPNGATVAWRV